MAQKTRSDFFFNQPTIVTQRNKKQAIRIHAISEWFITRDPVCAPHAAQWRQGLLADTNGHHTALRETQTPSKNRDPETSRRVILREGSRVRMKAMNSSVGGSVGKGIR